MYLFPAIDVLGGRVVRLAQGDYDRVTVYHEDAYAQALEFAAQGAAWLHVVDLDGARDGSPTNLELIKRLTDSGLKVEVGGGIRSLETIERYVQAGVKRLVLGTALVKDPEFAKAAAAQYPGMIVAGIDARDGEVCIQGWREGSRVKASELAAELGSFGISDLVYTDISRDGMRCGIEVAAYERLADISGARVVASGGVSSLADLKALAESGKVWGAIAGRALYEGEFTVADAIALLGPQED